MMLSSQQYLFVLNVVKYIMAIYMYYNATFHEGYIGFVSGSHDYVDSYVNYANFMRLRWA